MRFNHVGNELRELMFAFLRQSRCLCVCLVFCFQRHPCQFLLPWHNGNS